MPLGEFRTAEVSTPPESRRVRARIASLYELPSKGRRVPAMEGIRGVAVCLVFLVHFDQLVGSLLPRDSFTAQIFAWAGQLGHSGVDLFFLLSGYLIYAVVRSGKMSTPVFLRRRVQRIYPTFLAVMAAYVFFMLIAPAESKIPHGGGGLVYLLENALLMPGLFAIVPLITVAWSLSYEIFYYVALPAVYWIARIRLWNRPARVGFFLLAAAAYWFYCLTNWDVFIPALALHPGQHVRMVMFVAGILIYETLSVWPQLPVGRGTEALCALLTIVAVGAIPFIPYGTPAVFVALILFVAFGVTCGIVMGNEGGMLAGALSFAPLRWLGNMSYSYYLVHAVFVHVGRYLLVRAMPITALSVWIVLPITFALTWVGATIMFLVVEKPLSFRKHA